MHYMHVGTLQTSSIKRVCLCLLKSLHQDLCLELQVDNELPLAGAGLCTDDGSPKPKAIIARTSVGARLGKCRFPAPLLLALRQNTANGRAQGSLQGTQVGGVHVVFAEAALGEFQQVLLLCRSGVTPVQALRRRRPGTAVIPTLALALVQDELPLARGRVNPDDAVALAIHVVRAAGVGART